MKSSCRNSVVLALLCLVPCSGRTDEATPPIESEARPEVGEPPEDTEISGRVRDGLDRPVPGVRVQVISANADSGKPIAETLTDKEGRFSCKVARFPSDGVLKIEKEGYIKTVDSKIHGVYTLIQEIDWKEARELPDLKGDELDRGLREFLAREDEAGSHDSFSKDKYLFRYQTRFRPAFRKLVKEGHASNNTAVWLDLLGDPADEDLIPRGREYAPKHDVREEDLVEAIKAASRHQDPNYKDHPEEWIGIGFIAFSAEMDRALVGCGIQWDPQEHSCYWLFVFHKQGKKWVWRSVEPINRM